MSKPNLNKFAIPTDFDEGFPVMDSHHGKGETRVYLREIKAALLEHIANAEVVIGCVAWLTDFDILRALAGKRVVSILIQKEDFLRPDSAEHKNFHADLRVAYSRLPEFERAPMPSLVSELSTNGDGSSEAIRCVGFSNAHGPFRPRLHHKFCLFGRFVPGRDRPGFREDMIGSMWDAEYVDTYAAWTGSFNWTSSASHSLENAIYTVDELVVQNLTKEWANCFALSERLDWSSTYVEPEYRLGT